MREAEIRSLAKQAREARKFARAGYSNFPVGAALLCADGSVLTGCNVESSSYGLSICAERVVLTKALSEGHDDFVAIAIAAKDGLMCPPCGACRQLLHDYAPGLQIILTDGHEIQKIKLSELLPMAFDDSQLGRR